MATQRGRSIADLHSSAKPKRIRPRQVAPKPVLFAAGELKEGA
jgi:hypothetical protein